MNKTNTEKKKTPQGINKQDNWGRRMNRQAGSQARREQQGKREKGVAGKVAKGKNLQPRWWFPARLSFRFDRQIESFTDKQKLGEFSRRRQWTPLQYSCPIPWTDEPGRLQSMGSRRVRHDWETSLSLFTFMHWSRKWQPTPVFLPGESQGRGSRTSWLSL